MTSFNLNQLSSAHLDTLGEIGNIGAGHAATALSALLGSKVDMEVPNVRVVSFDEIIEVAGGADRVMTCVFLRIQGDLSMPTAHAKCFVKEMNGSIPFFEGLKLDEFARSAFEELGNILTGFTGFHGGSSVSICPGFIN
ncbi:MAG: chemotaxis protein CheC [Bacillus sp. (in: firmicutes)]